MVREAKLVVAEVVERGLVVVGVVRVLVGRPLPRVNLRVTVESRFGVAEEAAVEGDGERGAPPRAGNACWPRRSSACS